MNQDEPTHLLKLLYPRKWWENCNQCITISNRFCQVKQIEWVQPFFFLFLFICEYKIQMMKETWQKLQCWKTFMKGELTTILSQYSDDFPRNISLKKKREQNKGQWGKKTAWSGELPGNSHGLGSLQNSPEVKSHLNWDSISSNVTWSQFTRTGQVILWTGNHHWE